MNSPAPGPITNIRSENGQFRTDSCSVTDSPPTQNHPDLRRPDWLTEAELFRMQEWALYKEIMRAASSLAADLRKHPRRASLGQLATVLLLASELGRRACGMPVDGTPVDPPAPPRLHPTFEEALLRVYGSKEKTEPT